MNRMLLLAALASGAPALAAPINEQIDLPDGGEVFVENVCGEITVAGVDRPGVVVRGELGEKAELSLKRSGARVSIQVEGENRILGWSEETCATLRIELPVHTELDIEAISSDVTVGGVHAAIDIEVVSGDVGIRDGATSVDIEAVSSDVTIKGVVEELEIELVSGDITVTGASGRVDVMSVSGDLTLSGGDLTRVDVESVSGNVRIAGSLDRKARVDITSHSGDVELTLPKGTPGAFDLESFSGGIDLAGVAPKKNEYGPGSSLSHAVGDGDVAISITTFSGRVVIREK